MKPQKTFSSLLVVLVFPFLANMTAASDASDTCICTTMVAGVVAATAWFSPKVYCYYKECCRPDWVSFNKAGLEADLLRKLFGQHIASQVILKGVSGFMNNNNPKKPLVLSLHGLPGTGKNFVSQLIAENVYKEGMDSQFVHFFHAEHHFPHPNKHIARYKSELQQRIERSVTDCPTSMFIFDEMDKMHPELIDSITSFLDYYDKLDGVSYRKAIFIFLSNAGGNKIVEKTLEFWTAGRDREEIQLNNLEKTLAQDVFNNKQGGYITLINKNLVDFFVPFLPLEYKHVVLCAMAEMAAKGLTPDEDLAAKVAKEEIIYFPATQNIFSAKGCKTIQSKLDYYL